MFGKTSYRASFLPTLSATRSIMYSRSYPSSFTNSSSFSSTSISSSSPYPNSFLPSELVRSHPLRNIVASSRSDILIPAFLHPSVGFLITYIAPLAFVLLVTMGKEAYDDYKRNLRDREANSARYLVLASGASSPSDEEELSHSLLEGDFPPTRSVPSSSIRVGDLVLLEKNQRVPADLILLRTSDSSGTCFIRTDQLDGETDWKLRVAVPATQKLPFDHELLNLDAEIYGASLKADYTPPPPCLLILLPFLQRMLPARTSIHLLAHLRSTRRPLCPRTRCPWSKYRRSSRSLRRTCYGRIPCLLRGPLSVLWYILGQRRAR
jgi:hypothetical protein